jgi:glycosyltransferase involved in cell wall biosynthesis
LNPLVCIDCRYIRERPSGIGILTQMLVDHLPRLAPDLRFLLLAHPKAPGRLSAAPNVTETVVRQEANGPATLLWLPRVVDLSGVALFHATFNILPAGLRMPAVVTLCDVMWIKHADWARAPGLWGHVETVFYRRGIWHALRRATRLAAISQATKDEIGTVFAPAFDRTRVTLLGVAPEFRPLMGEGGQAMVDAARAKWLPGVPRYVFTVGQFSGYKNHVRVLQAFARAFADHPDVHMAYVQRLGPGQKALRPLARDLGVESRVHFLSGLSGGDLVALYNGALVLCHPSLYEGYGNAPAEALATGCPVVTSNRSSMPEVSGDAALLVDPESVPEIAAALSKAAFDQQVRATLRARGLARAKELTWEAFARANLEIYREILGERPDDQSAS